MTQLNIGNLRSRPGWGELPGAEVARRLNEERTRERLAAKLVRFLPIAQAVANMSKYAGTKVGALVLGPDFEIRASGWNGAPRGSAADVDERTQDRAMRLLWAAHAEANAIAQAARVGTALAGCQMVVTFMPCASCAKLIVQAGIVRVACPTPDAAFRERWGAELEVAEAMFKECGVDLIFFPEVGDV
jgi:dCMP deaminase